MIEYDDLECDLSVVLPAQVTTAINENENKMEYKNKQSGPLANTQEEAQTQHSIASVIDKKDRMVTNGMELREFDYNGCIFNGNTDGIGSQYDMLSGMSILFCFFLPIVLWLNVKWYSFFCSHLGHFFIFGMFLIMLFVK